MTESSDHSPQAGARRSWRPRRLLTVVLATVALTSLATVGALAGSTLFTDVNPGATHEEGIGWLAQSGVTAGCTADEYCPREPVTREQMATFLWRLSGNADGIDPSVDAAQLEGLSLAEVLAAAQEAVENGQDDPQDDAPEAALWAVVDADDTSTDLARSSGATAATGGVGTEGRFTVTFDRDVSECSYQATADVAPTKDDANVAEVRPGPTDESVDVWVTNTASGWVNTGFHLHVIC